MQDPDLVNNLVKTLLRFHEYSVALIADIEAMFYQVRIVGYCGTETTWDLWWPGGDLSKDPLPHRMKVHLSGTALSRSCSS